MQKPTKRSNATTVQPKPTPKKGTSASVVAKPQSKTSKPKAQASKPKAKKMERDALKSAAREAVRDMVISKRMPAYKDLENKYLQTVIDPERFAGVRYPDAYPKATAVVHALANHDVYVFNTTNGVETPGRYLNVLTPSLIAPLLEYTMATKPASSYDVIVLTQASDIYGFRSLTGSATSASAARQTVITAEWQNVVAPMYYAGVENPAPPTRGYDTAGNEFYGFPWLVKDSDSNVLQFAVMTSYAASDAAGGNLQVEFVTETGNLYKDLVPESDWAGYAGGSPGSFRWVVALTTAELVALGAVSTIAGHHCCPLPGMGIRLQVADIVDAGTAISVSGVFCNIFQTGSAPRPLFLPVELPDVEIYASTIDQFRVISAACWMEFEGAEMTNGGQAAAIMFRGGKPFGYSDLWDYDRVAETPGGYQGALKLGSYSFWFPFNTGDTLFRDIEDVERWARPYIVNTGLVSSPDLPHVLRLRIPINFEVISTSQFYNYSFGDIRPEWILHAAQVLRTMPTSMENPLHWKAIKGVLTKGVKAAGAVGNFIKSNWGWLAPAAGMLTRAL